MACFVLVMVDCWKVGRERRFLHYLESDSSLRCCLRLKFLDHGKFDSVERLDSVISLFECL